MAEFTMAEFIAEHKLEVNIRDTAATRLIATKLRAGGYQRIKKNYKGVVTWVWTNEKVRNIADLKEKLAQITL